MGYVIAAIGGLLVVAIVAMVLALLISNKKRAEDAERHEEVGEDNEAP